MSSPTLRSWLQEGPYTLAMSAGFFGFYAHAGVSRVLVDEGVAPARVTGSSAGSMIASVLAAGVPHDEIHRRLVGLERGHFWDPGLGAGLLRGQLFRALLDEVLDGKTFDACVVPCAVSVWELARFRTRVVTEGPLAPAVHASCALPGFFQPVLVNGRWCVDGGVRDRAALGGTTATERVLQHHLVDKATLQRGEVRPRKHGVVLAHERLPRPHPFALAEGARAYDEAARRTRAMLERPILDVMVS